MPCVRTAWHDANVVRLISWNMGDRPPGTPEKWEHLRTKLGADVALVQEAVVPDDFRGTWRAGGIAGRDGKARPWGSAVVALTDDVRVTPVGLAEGVWRGRRLGLAPIDAVSRGHVAIGVVVTPEQTFTAISAYGLMEFGYASGTMLRLLADLEPLFDDPVLGTSVVLAGDWNIGTWWSKEDQKYARREDAILSLLTAYGLEDVLAAGVDPSRGRLAGCPCEHGDACRHTWTYRKDDREVAYQDDYVFATPGLVSTALVPDAWDWQSELSDHAPLIIELRQ